jgi:protein transport protein SEC24
LFHVVNEPLLSSYSDLSKLLNKTGISVRLFCAGAWFSDFGVLAIFPGLTGGSVFHYPLFDEAQQLQFHNELFSIITKEYAWDCDMKLHFPKNINEIRASGNLIILPNNKYRFPIFSSDDNVFFEFEIKTPVKSPLVTFQASFFYTKSNSQRFTRIITFSILVSNDVKLIKESLDEALVFMSFSKHLMINSLRSGTAQALTEFQSEFNSFISARNSFRSIHYLVHSLLTSLLFAQAGRSIIETKMTYLVLLRSICPTDLILFIYPRMYVVNESPQILPLTSSSFGYGCCFLFHTISMIYIWIAPNVESQILQSIFGVSSVQELPTQIPKLQTKLNLILHQILSDCWTFSRRYIPVAIIPPGSSKETIFQSILVDDAKSSVGDLHSWFSQITNLRH